MLKKGEKEVVERGEEAVYLRNKSPPVKVFFFFFFFVKRKRKKFNGNLLAIYVQ